MPQGFVGAAGASAYGYTVLPHIDAVVDTLSRRSSIFGGLGMDTRGRERLVKTTDIGEGRSRDVATTSCVQTKEISTGDEARFNLGGDFEGEPTFNDYPVQDGVYPTFYHDNVRISLMDSPGYPFWGEMGQQRFANVITDMDPYYREKIAHWMAEWTDILGLEACFGGADRGQLLSTVGGLNLTIGNAPSAGYTISCKNTYVAGHGMVTWNATRATFENAIGTEIFDLIDDDAFGFTLDAHEAILGQIVSTLRFKEQEAFGLKLRAVALTDPRLMARIMARQTSNVWFTLMRDADVRGPQNHAINRDQAFILDKILYIPVDWVRAFRATGTDGAKPTYGGILTSDMPKNIATLAAASNKCPIVYLAVKALLHGRTSKVYGAGTNSRKGGRIWFSPDHGKYGKGGGLCAHTKTGFRRYEPSTKSGGTETYTNNQSLIAWFYDPGRGVAFAA
jgi:hypothetical protein